VNDRGGKREGERVGGVVAVADEAMLRGQVLRRKGEAGTFVNIFNERTA